MDKPDFIRIAPAYYEFAVILALQSASGYLSEPELLRKYTARVRDDDGTDDWYCYLENKKLLQFAIAVLVKKGAIEALLDPFGPSQFKDGPKLSAYMDEQRADTASPLFKAEVSGDVRDWLHTALARLNMVCRELEVSADDWRDPEGEWEPIPLDQESETLKAANKALSDTIVQVEQNNGYAASYPEERKFILDNLKLLSSTLKTAATTSFNYVKVHGLRVLQKLQERFGAALIGEAAKETAKALWALIREGAKAIW